jgi:hypothetical protein
MELFPKSSITVDIEKILNKDWKGRTFVYRSKYGGETFGTIKEVKVNLSYTHDLETCKVFTDLLDRKMTRKTKDTARHLPSTTVAWTGYRPSVIITSTNNNSYSLDEIFIIASKCSIELLNSESCILTATKTGAGKFLITDQFKDLVSIISSEEMKDFVHSGHCIVNTQDGKVWDYSKFPDSMKPDLQKLNEFIGIDS